MNALAQSVAAQGLSVGAAGLWVLRRHRTEPAERRAGLPGRSATGTAVLGAVLGSAAYLLVRLAGARTAGHSDYAFVALISGGSNLALAYLANGRTPRILTGASARSLLVTLGGVLVAPADLSTSSQVGHTSECAERTVVAER